MKPIFFLFFLLIPLASAAVDCSKVSNQQWCSDIQNSGLSEQEKSYLLSDIFSDAKNYPDHQLVENWNNRISTTTKPTETRFRSRGYVVNAWMKILSVNPSVRSEGKLYVDTTGKVFSGFSHQVSIPSGTASGDCKTRRYLEENRGTLRVYLNGILQGEGNRVNFATSLSHNQQTTVKAVYSIFVKTKIRHYQWEEYRFEDYSYWSCNYSWTEYKTDTLNLEEQIPVVIHNPELTADFSIKEKQRETTLAEFIVGEDVVNAELLFADSELNIHNYLFSEFPSIAPLNALTEQAERQQSVEQKNIVYEKNTITIPDTTGCKIILYSFFRKKEIACDVSYEETEFTVKTDKDFYSPDEPITVQIAPAGEYFVTYNGEEYETSGEISFPASPNDNRITVQADDKTTHKLIHVKNDEPLNAALSLSIFGVGNYVLLGFIRKYWGGLLG